MVLILLTTKPQILRKAPEDSVPVQEASLRRRVSWCVYLTEFKGAKGP